MPRDDVGLVVIDDELLPALRRRPDLELDGILAVTRAEAAGCAGAGHLLGVLDLDHVLGLDLLPGQGMGQRVRREKATSHSPPGGRLDGGDAAQPGSDQDDVL
jgi:hypothetical protein